MAAGFIFAFVCLLIGRRFYYAIFYLLAIVDTFAMSRYPFHLWVREQMINADSHGNYKQFVQTTLLLASCAVGLALIAMLRPRWQRLRTGPKLIVAGTAAVVFMLMLELVSLHAIDELIYRSIGPFFISAWAYAVGAFIAGTGALMKRPKLSNAMKTGHEAGHEAGHEESQ